MLKKNNEKWEAVIGEYLDSGKTITAFCKEKGINKSTFKNHLIIDPRYKAIPRRRHAMSGSAFLPVTVVKEIEGNIQINGFNIRISEETDIKVLQKLLTAMKEMS